MENRSGQPDAMENSPTQGRSATEQNRSGQPGAMENNPTQGRSAAEQNRTGTMEHRSVAPVTLSPDQKTEIHRVIIGRDIHRVGHADFNLAVGTAIPNTVRVYPVPARIVSIIPEYRGFDYIVVKHDLIIIDPATLQIVAVLPA